MKMCKRLVINLLSDELLIAVEDETTISLGIILKEVCFDSNHPIPDIPDEGERNSHSVRSLIDMASVIDILIVDDIEFNLSVLRKFLENLYLNCNCENIHRKYSVHSAISGKEALGLIEKQNRVKGGYRLVIMDCLMPEMDGWETAIAIRKLYELQQIMILPYIIAYSAFDSKEDIIKSKNSGMCDHVSKPSTQKDFCNKVSQWLSRSIIVS